jgi:transcriptional regulator
MYIPKFFKLDDPEKARVFIEKNSFGILINQLDGKHLATHIPLLIETNSNNETILSGHIAKANNQWKAFREDQEVLVIFQGPHAYISSSWYDHENVPTWNYTAVHVYGKIKISDNKTVFNQLSKLVDTYETENKNPVSISKMSAGMVENQMKAIVGFEILITEIQAAEKLSQNRDEKNYNNIIAELEKKGDVDSLQVAAAMKNLKR